MEHYISPLEIKTFLVQVSEKIHKKDLKNFVKTQLILNDYVLGVKDYLEAIYLEETSQYFIFVSKDTNKSFHFDAIKQKIKNSNKTYICCINSGVMYIFKNKEIYYFQVLDFTLDNNEINNLINEKLEIEIEDIIYFTSEELNEVDQQEIINSKYKNLNIEYRYNYFYLIIFFILILSILTMYIYSLEKEKPIKTVQNNNYLSKKIQNTIKILDKNKLEIIDLIYDNRLVVIVNIEKNILSDDLTKILKRNFRIENINFNHGLNVYKAELHVK